MEYLDTKRKSEGSKNPNKREVALRHFVSLLATLKLEISDQMSVIHHDAPGALPEELKTAMLKIEQAVARTAARTKQYFPSEPESKPLPRVKTWRD